MLCQLFHMPSHQFVAQRPNTCRAEITDKSQGYHSNDHWHRHIVHVRVNESDSLTPNHRRPFLLQLDENHATPIEIWRPVKIKGNAPGTTTCRKISHLDEPRHPAARKYSSSIESTPSMAFNVVTKNEAKVARKITGPSNPGSKGWKVAPRPKLELDAVFR